MTWHEQFEAAVAADPAGLGACAGCGTVTAERAFFEQSALCCVCWVRRSIEVVQKHRPVKGK